MIVEKYIKLSSDDEITEVIQYSDYYSRKVNDKLKYYWVNSNNDADNVLIETVLAVEVNDAFNFQNIKGESIQYVEGKDLGKKRYTINLTENSNNAIYMKYRIEDLGVLNLDTGELFVRLFTDDFIGKKIDNFKLTINIPNNVKELKYWGNGINNSSIYNIGMTELVANVSNLKIEDNVDIRLIFDMDVISNSSN